MLYTINYKSKRFHGLADGGYISFVYGCRSMSAWEDIRLFLKDFLFLMDHSSHRKNLYPLYKSRRKGKRDNDKSKQLVYEKVQLLRTHINVNESQFGVIAVPGAEADDLIALFHLFHPQISAVIGHDKDFVHVPGLGDKLIYPGGEPTFTTQRFWEKQSQYITAVVNCELPASACLIQALYGDRSDSIPRLMNSHPSRAKEELLDIFGNPDMNQVFAKALSYFGESLILNLKLVTLPGPMLMNEVPDGDTLIDLIISNDYWNPIHWSALHAEAWKQYDERMERILLDWEA